MQEMPVQANPEGTEERQLLEAREARQEARKAQLARDREQAEARHVEVSRQVAASVLASSVHALPQLGPAVTRARSALNPDAGDLDHGETERAIFAHILEKLTDYAGLMRMLNRLEAGFELSAAVKIYVCCRIIRHCQLRLDPLEAAFPAGARATLPAAFDAGDPEQVAAAIIGVDVPGTNSASSLRA